ncbi:MAG: hypothetical protein HQL33_10975 [Alphaproteobacteria bacterium]|nr:hypothetical protein [Alphaproteobacteria bacterium]
MADARVPGPLRRFLSAAFGCVLLSACASGPAGSIPKAASHPLPEIFVSPIPAPPQPHASRRPGVPPARLDPGSLPPRARPLRPLFEALRNLETGAEAGPVTILHLGDSHTAGDRFSGRLRELFQERFGAAGRGALPPGKPFKGFLPRQVSLHATPGWKTASSFDAGETGIFGLSGFRVRSHSPDDRMRLDSTTPEGFNLVEVEVLMQPKGGTFRLAVDDRPQGVYTTVAPSPQVGILRLPVPDGSRSVELRPLGGGPVELLSWATQRENHPGIVYESHGIVGATVNIVGRWDPEVTSWEIAHRAPALIVVVFGTNEGFNDTLTEERYEADFEARLDLLHRAAPEAAILVVGAPDGQRLSRACRKAARSSRPFPCGGRGNQPVRGCHWSTPVNLAMTRAVQSRVAARKGYYFWDWSRTMGGVCGMHDWVNRSPQLARGDHVHLQPEGYALSAEALFADLMALYGQIPGGK